MKKQNNKIKNRKNITFVSIILAFCALIVIGINFSGSKKPNYKTASIEARSIKTGILANGKIASQNEATLHFQTGGKLTYLAAKEGDTVYQGQTIANLDTTMLQKQLQITANNYQVAKNNNDQVSENNQAGVLEGQQRTGLDTTNKNSYSSITQVQVITDAVKRIVNNNLLTQNSAQINVDLANYAIQLSSIVAPFSGMVIHEDVNVSNVNVTPATSFVVIDPNTLVFRAQVNEQDIDYIDIGSLATVEINGDGKKYLGTVTKIYPQKVTLPTGQSYYQVDVESPQLKDSRYDQSGSVQIQSNVTSETLLVPAWVVLNGQNVWVRENDKNILKTVKTGKTHGDVIEILSGLKITDRIIVNPQAVVINKYSIL